jgi:outer membrane protein assembly factor BamA
MFGELNILPSTKTLGANTKFTQATLDLSLYKSLSKSLVFATNIYTLYTFGKNVPFSQLAQLGGSKKMRGIYQGFFRDKNTALL